jgi:membrane associated rhomboid family serine protease
MAETETADEFAARQGAYGWRLLRRITLILVVLVLALVLASQDVPGAKVVAVAAVFAFVGLMYVGPWLGPRRRKRRQHR